MPETKTIPASNWTGKDVTIEILDEYCFRLHGYTFELIETSEDSFEIKGDAWPTILGRVYRFDGEYVALVSGIEREGSDLITVAAQALANTI